MSNQKPNPSNDPFSFLLVTAATAAINSIATIFNGAKGRKAQVEAERKRLEAKAIEDFKKPIDAKNLQIFVIDGIVQASLFSDRLNSFNDGEAIKIVEFALKTEIKQMVQQDDNNAYLTWLVLCAVVFLREKLGFLEAVTLIKSGKQQALTKAAQLLSEAFLEEKIMTSYEMMDITRKLEKKSLSDKLNYCIGVAVPYAKYRYPDLLPLLEKEKEV